MRQNQPMKKYKKEIVEILNTYSSKKQFYPGIRWAFDEISDESEYLILGINPSNSYSKVKSVINKSELTELKTLFTNQKEYNEFLSKKENEGKITTLQREAHKYHPHFKKHKNFASYLGIEKSYQFFDLFPIWEIKQEDLLADLDKNIDLKNELIDAFNNLIERKSNIKALLFFNAKAAKFYFKNNHIEHKSIKFKLESQRKYSYVIKGEVKNINVLGFGIGGWDFSGEKLIELAQKTKLLLKQ